MLMHLRMLLWSMTMICNYTRLIPTSHLASTFLNPQIISSYIFGSRIQQQIAAQQAYHDNLIRQNRYRGNSGYASGSASGSSSGSGGSYNSHRYAPSYAAAAGSIGPNGYRQTAFINPANPVSLKG